ncbi:MAG: deoxynucleoside kinase [Anaerolineaceae bacterium]|mgnify:CR=1 FL=1|nr:deoxynucleoside kinase [Anaerolineaceae bacterium]MDI9531334.1 deoxynucleoside kinase [Chloroflexota bacterium]
MYIAIEGVIGVGKTTLARLIHEAFEADVLLEVFEENPFLGSFYADRQRYAFQTQIFFLMSRFTHQHQVIPSAMSAGRNIVSDYTFDKDALFAGINLSGDELDIYHKVHSALADKIPQPDLLIYLRAATKTLMHRIAHRDRPYERSMDQAYIEELANAYEKFIILPKWEQRLQVIDTDDLDIVADPKALQYMIDRIRQALQLAPYQESLPLSD